MMERKLKVERERMKRNAGNKETNEGRQGEMKNKKYDIKERLKYTNCLGLFAFIDRYTKFLVYIPTLVYGVKYRQ